MTVLSFFFLCRLLVSLSLFLSLSVLKHPLLPQPLFLLTLILASLATKLTRIPSFLWCHPKCHWPSAMLVVLVVLYIYVCVCVKYMVRAFIHSCLIRLQSVNKCSPLWFSKILLNCMRRCKERFWRNVCVKFRMIYVGARAWGIKCRHMLTRIGIMFERERKRECSPIFGTRSKKDSRLILLTVTVLRMGNWD